MNKKTKQPSCSIHPISYRLLVIDGRWRKQAQNKHKTSTKQAQNKHKTSTKQAQNKHKTSTKQVQNKYKQI